jgi:DNA (cytosine-5)-methyltransferase 3A
MNKLLSNLVVLSLFDGISCGQLALAKALVEYSEYYASELSMIKSGKKRIKIIPNPAIDIVKFHFPKTKHIGDVRDIDGYRFRGIVNLLIGGSPCKDFSMCGKRKGMTTKCDIMVTSLDQYLKLKSEGFEFEGQSYLFWEFVRLLKEIKPRYFLLENVMMKSEWAKIITDALGVDPIYINSSDVSGQIRERLYWTNIPYTPIEDKGIELGDDVLGAVRGVGKHGKKILNTRGFNYKQGDFEYNPYNKAYCIVTGGGRYENIQGEIKRFTAENCEKLQRIPVGYTAVTGLCKTKRIELIGNAWTVDVLVEAFFKNLPWASKMKVEPITNFLNV